MKAFHKAFENARVYEYTQLLNPFTVGVIRQLIKQYLSPDEERKIIDIGCGVGTYSKAFSGKGYLGVDINPEYIAQAKRVYGDKFRVMNAGAMVLSGEKFDAAFTISTCHHLSNTEVASMIGDVMPVLREGGCFHVIDAVLPITSIAPIKNTVFKNDRGRNQRTLEEMSSLLASVGIIEVVSIRRSLLHDMCYFRLSAKDKSNVSRGAARVVSGDGKHE